MHTASNADLPPNQREEREERDQPDERDEPDFLLRNFSASVRLLKWPQSCRKWGKGRRRCDTHQRPLFVFAKL